MSAPRSVAIPTSESLVWVRVSHQPSTKPHAWNGNRPCEAGVREVSGFNVSECIQPRNITLSRKSRCFSYGRRQHSLCRSVQDVIKRSTLGTLARRQKRRGRANPTGSKAVARYQTELLRTWESQYVPRNGYAIDKLDRSKQWQTTYWQSDYPIVPMKWGNAQGWEGDSSNAMVCGETSTTHRGRV